MLGSKQPGQAERWDLAKLEERLKSGKAMGPRLKEIRDECERRIQSLYGIVVLIDEIQGKIK